MKDLHKILFLERRFLQILKQRILFYLNIYNFYLKALKTTNLSFLKNQQ